MTFLIIPAPTPLASHKPEAFLREGQAIRLAGHCLKNRRMRWQRAKRARQLQRTGAGAAVILNPRVDYP